MAADVRNTNPTRGWHRSSRCTPGKNCVEIGRARIGVVIRDSKSRSALRAIDDVPWAAFLAHCRAMR
jgi:uncharacterized protein DUF397